METVQLAHQGQEMTAALYILACVPLRVAVAALGIVSVWALI